MPSAHRSAAAGFARRSWKRFRAWMRPPRELKITRFGWFFIMVTLGVGVAAINTENNLLYLVLGLLLGLIAGSGILSETVIRDLQIDWCYPPDPVAGRPFLYELLVRNAKRRLPTFAVQIEDRSRGTAIGKTFIFRIGAGETVSRAVEGRFSLRGRAVLSDFRVSTRFPFGLFEKALVSHLRREVIVLPLPEPGRVDELAGLPDSGQATSGRPGHGAELYALRAWQAADGTRKIHWRKSAGGAGLQTKVFEAEQRPQVTLALCQGGGLPLEQAVSVGAWWIEELERRGFRVGLVAGGRVAPDSGSGHRLRLLRALALYEPGESPALDGTEHVLRHA